MSKVYLVGAGPGDPELLTLKAVRALARADVVLCDELVDEGVLQYVRPGARVVRVGKRGGLPSTSQRFIEGLMISEARRGRRVVRLKGGDPFVFGRGGEECEALRAAQIPFEVVNGVTSGLAAPAAAGIPVTHRAWSHGVSLVTGHDPDAVDWAALARSGLTLVVYMGIARCEDIRRSLLEGGMRASTPAAVVANGTRRDQRSLRTTLGHLARDIRAGAIASPAIIILGDVIRASGALEMAQEVEEHLRG